MDPRQRRSRDLLHRAVLALAAEQPIGELTMTAIARKAGVHRSTAHEHASSPSELLNQALSDELDALEVLFPTPGASRAEVASAMSKVMRAVLDHVHDHLAIYRDGLGDGSDGSLRPMLARQILESTWRLRETVGLEADVEVSGAPREFVIEAAERFIAEGTVGVLASWVAQPDPRVDSALATYQHLLPAWWPREVFGGAAPA